MGRFILTHKKYTLDYMIPITELYVYTVPYPITYTDSQKLERLTSVQVPRMQSIFIIHYRSVVNASIN